MQRAKPRPPGAGGALRGWIGRKGTARAGAGWGTIGHEVHGIKGFLASGPNHRPLRPEPRTPRTESSERAGATSKNFSRDLLLSQGMLPQPIDQVESMRHEPSRISQTSGKSRRHSDFERAGRDRSPSRLQRRAGRSDALTFRGAERRGIGSGDGIARIPRSKSVEGWAAARLGCASTIESKGTVACVRRQWRLGRRLSGRTADPGR